MASPEYIIEKLGLQEHPEGGWYAETWRDEPEGGGRGAGTAIWYLLREGECSRRHRIDATEIWHHYDGAPLELTIQKDGEAPRILTLGKDLLAGELPQLIVPGFAWQTARSLGAWSLVGCTVSPAFDFAKFELS